MRKRNFLRNWITPTIILGVLALIGWRYAQSADPRIGVSSQEAVAIGTDAYIYGYPDGHSGDDASGHDQCGRPQEEVRPYGTVRVVAGISYRSGSRSHRSER